VGAADSGEANAGFSAKLAEKALDHGANLATDAGKIAGASLGESRQSGELAVNSLLDFAGLVGQERAYKAWDVTAGTDDGENDCKDEEEREDGAH